MYQAYPASLRLSRRLLRLLISLNILVGVGILIGLVASVIAPEFMMRALLDVTSGTPRLLTSMRSMMVIGLIGIPVTHIVLTRLLSICDTVVAGTPFVIENARRLKTMAWSLLTLELLHIVVGVLTFLMRTDVTPVDMKWDFSITRWLAVLLVFVLARVFENGAVMKDELEGTI